MPGKNNKVVQKGLNSMTKKSDGEQTYQQLKQELEQILEQLQHQDTDVDKAIKLHKQGQETVKKLEQYLKDVSKKAGLK